jgi:mRNA interferase MazF
VVGHEQGGTRPVLVVSGDAYNAGPSELVVVVPITGRLKCRVPMHVEVDPPEGGLRLKSAILCDAVRSISRQRLESPWGTVSEIVLGEVAERLAALLDLP